MKQDHLVIFVVDSFIFISDSLVLIFWCALLFLQRDDPAQAIHSEGRCLQLWNCPVGAHHRLASLPEHDCSAGSLCCGEQGSEANYPKRLSSCSKRYHDPLLGRQSWSASSLHWGCQDAWECRNWDHDNCAEGTL